MFATPQTWLKPDTPVHVKDRKGIIIKTIEGKDQFGRPINSFKIKLNEKWVQGHRKYIKINPIINTVNYSCVQY